MATKLELIFSDEVFYSLKHYEQKLNCPSIGDFIGDALSYYFWTLEQQEKGFQIVAEKTEGNKKIIREVIDLID